MKSIGKIFLALALIVVTMGNTYSQNGAWVKLGTRLVNFAVDRDEVIVTGQEGVFDAIKVKVYGAAINMHRVVVHYRNGTSQEIDLRNNFAPGSESRVCDLTGNERIITKIVFFYDTKNPAPRKAKVEVWGRH
jgi:hypothetical protein